MEPPAAGDTFSRKAKNPAPSADLVEQPGGSPAPTAGTGNPAELRSTVRRGTILDELIGEMLGDIGKLHKQVEALRDAFPQIESALRHSGAEAVEVIRGAVADATGDLTEAVKADRAAAAEAAQETSLAIKSITKAAAETMVMHKGRLDAHISGLVEFAVPEITRRAGESLDGLKTEASEIGKLIAGLRNQAADIMKSAGTAPSGWRDLRLLIVGLLTLSIGLAAGLGAGWALHLARLSDAQLVAIQAGLDIERAFSTLDLPTRQKVRDAIEHSRPLSRGQAGGEK